VLFDLDGTLFDHPGAFRRGILAHLAVLGDPFSRLDPDTAVAAWQEVEDEYFDRYLAGEMDYEEQRRARARGFLAHPGIAPMLDAPRALDDEAALAWFLGYYEAYRSAWAAYDDMTPALDALEAAVPGIRFGIITNGELALQQRKIDLIGATPRMEHVIASGELGIAKPDARIFAHAIERFGAEPGDVVYVGDRIRTDALGAAGAGLAGVWIDRDRRGWGGLAADAAAAGIRRIVSLAELPELLSR